MGAIGLMKGMSGGVIPLRGALCAWHPVVD